MGLPFLYLLLVLNALAAIFLSYLLAYHAWLCAVGKTTYQHICEQRVRNQIKKEEENFHYL